MTKEQIVYVVDDDPAVLVSVCAVLACEEIGTASYRSGREFLKSYSPLSPGCLLLDVHMPDMSGLELQEQLVASGVYLPVIMITGLADVSSAVTAMKHGAIDFIEKPFSREAIVSTVRRAFLIDTQLNGQRMTALKLSERVTSLTERECTVLDLAAQGYTSKEAARVLDISPRTIDAHRGNILKKLGVKSVSQFVRSITSLRVPELSKCAPASSLSEP